MNPFQIVDSEVLSLIPYPLQVFLDACEIQKRSLFNLNNAKEYPTLKDLMKEQGVSTDLSDYWDKECELNPSNPHCLEYDD